MSIYSKNKYSQNAYGKDESIFNRDRQICINLQYYGDIISIITF